MVEEKELLTIREASEWATEHTHRQVTTSNIAYLIQYGRIRKSGANGNTLIAKSELFQYYRTYNGMREADWRKKLGDDLNWHLSFDYLKESDTTKHVHRLHPYKGKFIPQLVEYFLDGHTDEFKKEAFFKQGDIVLDPFCGSGTTLVQANELGMHAIGVDVSAFNALISNVKIEKHDFVDLQKELQKLATALKQFLVDSHTVNFDRELTEILSAFNNKYFPSPEYKYRVKQHEVDEDKYGAEKERKFRPVFEQLVKKYHIQVSQENSSSFLDIWYVKPVRDEIEFLFERVRKIKNINTKKVVSIILSRTIRSCRATTHADLATLKEPIRSIYYCAKHGKVCKPLFSILGWWERYSKDTVSRLAAFNSLRTATNQVCLTGDSRTVDLFDELEQRVPAFAQLARKKKINGIFSSPPYVGLIDYHEQHAYAYDLFKFNRKDALEIGALFKGTGREARESYVQGIADVLNNCRKFLADDFNIFLVANDKNNLYPLIAENAGLKIVQRFKRPVLNRTEKDKGAYSEIIFHLRY